MSGLRSAPRCRTTPNGIPVRLLVDAPRRRRWPWLLALALAAAAAVPAWSGVQGRLRPRPAAPAPPAVPAAPAPAAVNRVLQLEAPAQGRAPEAVTAHAEIVAPSGARVRLPAFAQDGRLAARVRPREAGLHRWRLVDGAGGAELAAGEFRAEDAGLPGQVVVRGAALATEDGRPFRPLGESRLDVHDPEWTDRPSADAFVARLAADGMNTLRLAVFGACGRDGAPAKRGCLEPALGRFDERAAAEYDAIFRAAEAHGVKVVLSIFAIGFGAPDREAARRRLRYVLARWSASPALLSVDLLDEPQRDGAVPEGARIPGAEDLARTWRAEDPYGHPVTAGRVGPNGDGERDERAWWASPACDVVQWLRQGEDGQDVHALARALVATVRDTARHGKPVLVGELGWGGEARPLHEHGHVGLWASIFAGAGVLARSAPALRIDSDEPMTPDRARHLRTLAAFLARADAREALRPVAEQGSSVRGMRVLAMAGASTMALWLHAPRQGYGAPVRGAELALRGLAPGRWRLTWVDDVSGADLASEARVAGAGAPLVVRVPEFTRHVAALVERIE